MSQNRINAQHSTGPRTEAGKAISSQNARKHGLTGKQVVIPGEDPAQYDEHRDQLFSSYKPANEAERILVDQIAVSSWRLDRAQRLEQITTEKLISASPNAHQALADLLAGDSPELKRMRRYLTQFERAYYRAIKELASLQRARAKNEQPAAKAKPKTKLGFTEVMAASGFVLDKNMSMAEYINAPPPAPPLSSHVHPTLSRD